MTVRKPDHDDRRKRQKGALMAGLVAMIAISLIWSAIAFQAWIDVLRRDNEAEMIFRAQEIVRAIQRYRKDHAGQGPRKLELLLEPSPRRSRYIRREYDDPLVADGKWGLLFMGPGGQIIDPSVDPGAGLPGEGPGALSGGLKTGAASRQTLAGNQSAKAGQLGGIANSGRRGGEQTGLPIAGVKSLCTDQPFRVYKGENNYSKWLFTFLDVGGNVVGKGKRGKGKVQGNQLRRNPGDRSNRNNRIRRP